MVSIRQALIGRARRLGTGRYGHTQRPTERKEPMTREVDLTDQEWRERLSPEPVSYTHLDVYKRQLWLRPRGHAVRGLAPDQRA